MIEIDSFGNLITNITADMLAGRPTDRRACIVCNIYETWGIYHSYAEQPSGTLVAVIGSGGRLELAIVRDNAAQRLGIGVGTPVTLAWETWRGTHGFVQILVRFTHPTKSTKLIESDGQYAQNRLALRICHAQRRRAVDAGHARRRACGRFLAGGDGTG